MSERARAQSGGHAKTLADYQRVLGIHPGYRRAVRKRASRPDEQVYAVTGLPVSPRDEQRGRTRRYLLSMGIRTLCFVLAVVALGVLHWTVVGWTLVIAAVILPYIAVVVANATKPRGSTAPGPVTPGEHEPPRLAPGRPDEEPPR
jgi:hypothetical protein